MGIVWIALGILVGVAAAVTAAYVIATKYFLDSWGDK